MKHTHERTPEQQARVAALNPDKLPDGWELSATGTPTPKLEKLQVVKTQIIGGRDDLPSTLIDEAAQGDPGEGDEELALTGPWSLPKPSTKLANGATVIAARRTAPDEALVLALTNGIASEAYATWRLDLKRGLTYMGEYQDSLYLALEDYRSRIPAALG